MRSTSFNSHKRSAITACAALCPSISAFSASKTNTGFSIGGGIEGSVWLPANWTWKLEYLYLNLGTLDFATSLSVIGGTTTHVEFTDNIVRVGLNYKFSN
jgi:outer membrane immunogenic protein